MKWPQWFRWLCGERPVVIRPRPPGWNKTLTELSAENRSQSADEIRWAREYEREQLRAWARFPKDGEHFEAARDLTVRYLVHWKAPYSTGGDATLVQGTRVRVSVPPGDPEPIGVYTTPVDEKEFERRFIPAADRSSGKYAGYSVFLYVAQLNRDFRLVPPESAPS
jgi:hypothetical protein